MSLAAVYDTVRSAWIEGRLENVLQRKKELAGLHAALRDHESRLTAAFAQDIDISETAASLEINVCLAAVDRLYHGLDFAAVLAQEKLIQVGQPSPINPVALGPVLIQAALPCPLSSTILPLAAAVAAGSCCLVQLCHASPTINEALSAIIRTSLDQEAVATVDGLISPAALTGIRCEAAVLQDPEGIDHFASALRQSNSAVRIYTPVTGLPAVFVDRSAPDLNTVAIWLQQSILKDPRRHVGRTPRLCFVDEFVLERLVSLLQQRLGPVENNNQPVPEPSVTKELGDLLASSFLSLKQQDLWATANALSPLIALQPTDSITPETIGKVATKVTKSYSGILFVPVSSLDHAIDLWNKVIDGKSASATYVFGEGKETAYLAQFLNTENCFINHIPPESFVMMAPNSGHDTYGLPFSPADFSRNKAIHQWSNRVGRSSSHRGPDLRAIAQPIGGRLSYFEQGLIVGLAATAFALLGSGIAAFKAWKYWF
ncbi:hypothetical protein P170DRAFT_426884 [Aspergillus steynii IBT 23096]|uniref:Aldehyde dehydrogenase domain-containing protein n=1 Tax=Aspergillus steynii IBT 23096 TaxID=1392250 RepID=A0A2I2G452_9EURO|nr:uncharacterized protein P170DRAFT_426884 [Aspergillus steynii IBT 23096]PLB47648.1 hypothetical protein P170DRAFT_426884 [Aspergillus steynii IBT 23096]